MPALYRIRGENPYSYCPSHKIYNALPQGELWSFEVLIKHIKRLKRTRRFTSTRDSHALGRYFIFSAKAKGVLERIMTPRPPRPPRPRLPPRMTRGQRAYELRATGITWAEVGQQLRLQANGAVGTARYYAKTRNMPWPIDTTVALRQRAYDLACEGLTREEIGEQLHVGKYAVTALLKRYCNEQGCELPRPLKKYTPVSDKSRQVYEMYYVQDMTAAEVGRRMGYAHPVSTSNVARRYAKMMGLPAIRKKPPYDPGRGKTSYEMRLQGNTWASIATFLGYAIGGSASKIARSYAAKNGLPTPI